MKTVLSFLLPVLAFVAGWVVYSHADNVLGEIGGVIGMLVIPYLGLMSTLHFRSEDLEPKDAGRSQSP